VADASASTDDAELQYKLRSAAGKLTTSDEITRNLGFKRDAFANFDNNLRRFFADYWEEDRPYLKDGAIKVSYLMASTQLVLKISSRSARFLA
jgi:hypothetical protein